MAPRASARQLENRQSVSPRATRSGRARSQSVELGGDKAQSLQPKRRTRQGSAEISSSAPNTQASRRPTRATANLPTVAENDDDEDEEAAAAAAVIEDAEDDEHEAEDLPSIHKHSPSSLSQVSATTAFSNTTSFSVKALADIDDSAADRLPELCKYADDILELLAPQVATKSQVETIFKDLRISGSERAESLREAEDAFKQVRKLYGTRETYIQVQFLSRKLFGKQTPAEGRIDAIVHVANLATMVKEFLVYEQSSSPIHAALGDLETFPMPFLTSFDNVVRYGNSKLLRDTFDMFLDIRTQSTVAALRDTKDEDSFSPEEILATHFFEEPAQLSEGMVYLDNVIEKGTPKGLFGATVTRKELLLINRRVERILSAFRAGEDAQDASDLVDFERLEEMFPWLDFLTNLVTWSRKRLLEALVAIDQQGGLDTIAASLSKLVPASQNAQIVSTREGVKYFKGLRDKIASSSISRPQAERPKLEEPIRFPSPSPMSEHDDLPLPDMSNGNREISTRPRHRSTDEYVSKVVAFGRERNKENRPELVKTVTKSSNPRQTIAGPSKQRNVPQHVDESSEDEAFMLDQRHPKRASKAIDKRPSKRAHISPVDDENLVEDQIEENDFEGGDVPASTFQQVSRLADVEAARARLQQNSRTQVRKPWSVADEEHLLAGIGKYGCKWAALANRGGFEVERDQGALKDKARNMAVKFYKSDIPLPVNFENVALGKKEIRAIQGVRGEQWQPPFVNDDRE